MYLNKCQGILTAVLKKSIRTEMTGINNGIDVRGTRSGRFDEIITPEAMEFVANLVREFRETRKELLQTRIKWQKDTIDSGTGLDFLSTTEEIKNGDWKIDPIPKEIEDRRVEITGPASNRKMVINALNSGANVYMADAEDAESPTWNNLIYGQVNLKDAVRGVIEYNDGQKQYALHDKTAVLFFRPRGWHLLEKHILIDGEPISASLFDFGLYFYHNAKELLDKGKCIYFYLPKIEHYPEAKLWNDVFVFAQNKLGLPRGTVKATALIETITAVFEMDEILYELKEHSAGLNCGRWDYIFSFIKKFSKWPNFVLPNRAEITMDKPFLRNYVDLLVATCHKRGAHAMGGMSAYIPIKGDTIENEKVFIRVRGDKTAEVLAECDGAWVAHPGLVPVVKKVFDEYMPEPNQINKTTFSEKIGMMTGKEIARDDLLKIPEGKITIEGLVNNINVGIQYLHRWLLGNGAVPINGLMEDMATAEISRSQLWQWRKHEVRTIDGIIIDDKLMTYYLDETEEIIKEEAEKAGEIFYTEKFKLAVDIFRSLVMSDEFPEFMTSQAYDEITYMSNYDFNKPKEIKPDDSNFGNGLAD